MNDLERINLLTFVGKCFIVVVSWKGVIDVTSVHDVFNVMSIHPYRDYW